MEKCSVNTVLNDVAIYDDFLNIYEVEEIENNLASSHNWGFQGSTDEGGFGNYKFLSLDLTENKFITETIFEKVKNKIGENFAIDRVYANGQYFGMPGRPHNDHVKKDRYTFLIYVNSYWDMLWCGQTIFFNRYVEDSGKGGNLVILNNDTKVVYPFPGRATFFPSNIIHYAESPSKDCFRFRFTVAYKLRKL